MTAGYIARAPAHHTPPRVPRRVHRLRTGALLLCGAAAGPWYVLAGSIEAATRRGFDLRHQDLSLLANGALGWIHIAVFVITGALLLAGSRGLSDTFAGQGRAARSGPRLLAAYGAGMILAGVFVADPMSGFPPGTPTGKATHVSGHGTMHFVASGLAFVALIGACLVLAARYSGQGRRRFAAFSRVTGVLFVVAFVGIATGSSAAWIVVGFGLAVVLAFGWLTTVLLDARTRRT
jgi:uncharacterized protein DUF998